MPGSREVTLLPGMLVYVQDSREGWVSARLISVENNRCTVTLDCSQEKFECCSSLVLPAAEQSLENIATLTELSNINQASVLLCLCERFSSGQYYTGAGSTVIAVNPFCHVDHLYTRDTVLAYHEETQDGPHIYSVACRAYRNLCRGLSLVNQCIIVSGESGSGKTVSAKHLLRYMTIVSTLNSHNNSVEKVGHSIEQRILDSNPILEAFGNARTQRNNNSSRFGKYIKLQFSRSGAMLGGEIQTYLLEKTRVVHQSPAEANFHIFYQVVEALSRDLDTPLGRLVADLGPVPFRVLPDPAREAGTETHSDLRETLYAMSEIGLAHHLQQDIVKVLVGVLFLCNVKISPLEEELCQLLSDQDDRYLDTAFMALEVSENSLQQAGSLLGLEPSHIEQVLLYRNIESGGHKRRSVFIKPVPEREANSRRDCLATLVYARLFEWLVKFINGRIKADSFDHTIGLLDIYGFEAFESNSLEQLCINYANERLQQHYVTHFLRDLQREYEDECISWSHLVYTDNQPCLDILHGPSSVFGVLNEDVQLNRQSDPVGLCERVVSLAGGSQYLAAPRQWRSQPAFTIHHYAGHVTYSVQELSTKNRDNVPLELVSMLQRSRNQFVADLFRDFTVEDSTGRKRKTVLGKFRVSLDQLMSSLRSADVHYIRCIKPNLASQAGVFDRPYVMSQLVAGGIIETVKISSLGYPVRMPYPTFLQRYGLLIRNLPPSAVVTTGTSGQSMPASGQYVSSSGQSVTSSGQSVSSSGQSVSGRGQSVPAGGQFVTSSGQSVTSSGQTSDVDLSDPLDVLYHRQLDMLPHTPRKHNTPKRRLRRRAGVSSDDHTRRCSATVLRLQFGDCPALMRQFGKTKLFLHQHQVNTLEESRYNILCDKARSIQRAWRRHGCRRRRRAASVLQRAWHRYVQRRCRKRTAAILLLQKSVRMFLAREKVKKLRAQQIKQKEKPPTLPKSWKPIMDRRRTRSISQDEKNSRAESPQGKQSSSLYQGVRGKGEDLSMLTDAALDSETKTVSFKTSTPVSKESPRHVINNEKTAESDEHRQKIAPGKENIPRQTLMPKGRPKLRGNSNKQPRSTQQYFGTKRTINTTSASSIHESLQTSVDQDNDSGCSPVKKQKTETGYRPTLQDLTIGDGVISRRRMPKVSMKFHTRASVLKHAHCVPKVELQSQGLQDCLSPSSLPTNTGNNPT